MISNKFFGFSAAEYFNSGGINNMLQSNLHLVPCSLKTFLMNEKTVSLSQAPPQYGDSETGLHSPPPTHYSLAIIYRNRKAVTTDPNWRSSSNIVFLLRLIPKHGGFDFDGDCFKQYRIQNSSICMKILLQVTTCLV